MKYLTVVRTSFLNYLGNCLIIGITTILAFVPIPMSAQLQDWVNSQPNPNPPPAIIDIAYPLGRTGIGTLYPATMLHVHSLQDIAPAGNILGPLYPAILRLQTQHSLGNATTGVDGNKFGQSEIQFWSNSDYRAPIGGNQFVLNKWQVSAIKSINQPEIGTDPDLTQAGGIFRGGIAFFCSGSPTFGDAQNLHEVMRIVDKQVGIKTIFPYSNASLDVRGTISIGGFDDVVQTRVPGVISFIPKNNLDNNYHIDNYGINTQDNPPITYGSQLRFSSGLIPGGGPQGEGTMMVMESQGGSVGIGNYLANLGGSMANNSLNLKGQKGTLSILRNPLRAGVAPVALRVEQGSWGAYPYWWSIPLISAGAEDKSSFQVFANGYVHIGDGASDQGAFGLMRWQKQVNGSWVSTNNPHVWDAKLVVKGKAVVQELYVTTTADYWADYVFDENYNLMPLDEVESHIKANHHLPNIPSAKQVSEDGGSSVGDM